MRLRPAQPHSDEASDSESQANVLRSELSNYEIATADLKSFGVQLYAVSARTQPLGYPFKNISRTSAPPSLGFSMVRLP